MRRIKDAYKSFDILSMVRGTMPPPPESREVRGLWWLWPIEYDENGASTSCLLVDLFWGQTNDHVSSLATLRYCVVSQPKTQERALEDGLPDREGEAQVSEKDILQVNPQLSACGS